MRFTKDIEYAFMGLVALDDTTDLLSARDLSEEFRIPHGLLSKILQRLVSGGIVESVQGARGGYRMSRPSCEITLGSIIEAVHGPRHLVPCLDEEECDQLDVCNIRNNIGGLQSIWDELVYSMTLEQFIQSRGKKTSTGVGVGF